MSEETESPKIVTPQTITNRQGLVVGLPLCGRPVVPEWAISLAVLQYPSNMNVSHVALKGAEVGEARCRIAESAVAAGAKYLFFLDDDVAPPDNAVRKLIYDLENADADVMVAAGIYVNKHQYPAEPMVFQADGTGPFWKWKIGEVFECASVGTGCMMIKTEVFQHIPQPWFRTVHEFSDEPGKTHGRIEITDDIWFCQLVKNAGFKIIADGGVLPFHWDVLACACGHSVEAHDKGKADQPCDYRPCDCKRYKMTGKHFTLPPDSYPVRPRTLAESLAGY